MTSRDKPTREWSESLPKEAFPIGLGTEDTRHDRPSLGASANATVRPRPCENPANFCKQSRRAKFFAIFSLPSGLRARKSEQNRSVSKRVGVFTQARPFAALQERPCERSGNATKRSSAGGVRCARSSRSLLTVSGTHRMRPTRNALTKAQTRRAPRQLKERREGNQMSNIRP
jgi:hypothetical protein